MAVKLTKFKIGLYVFFVLCAIGSIVALRYGGNDSNTTDNPDAKPAITLWSTVSEDTFNRINSSKSVPTRVTFRRVSASNAYVSYLESVANGAVPDVIIMPYRQLNQFFSNGRTMTIPYASYTERTFDDTFIAGASFLKSSAGLIALPVFADPLVMYYNRSILDNAGVLSPITKWSEAYAASEKLTVRAGQLGINRAAFGLGEAVNITNPTDIMAGLFMQLGLSILRPGSPSNQSDLSRQTSSGNAGASALRFYTSFADPSKNHYTWNRSLGSDRSLFLAESLVYYFGKASERASLQRDNPNMNLDMALFPQADNGQPVTTGDLYVAIFPRGSARLSAAVSYVYWLTTPSVITNLTNAGSYPYAPVVRAALAKPGTDRFSPIIYQSAIVSRYWFDPNYAQSQKIFSDMIADVTTGRLSPEQSINRTIDRLTAL